MHVDTLGLSPLKGGTPHHPGSAPFADHGPVGDRRFCCVDPVAARVLRTVENPTLLGVRVAVAPDPAGGPDVLTLEVPGAGPVTGPVVGAGRLRADYWGREPELRLLEGPWADALSPYLDRRVALAEAAPRHVVYAGGVTVVTTSSLREVARRAGLPTDPAALRRDAERWRANLVVDTGDAAAFVEDAWPGRRLQVGGVVLQARAAVPRCAVARLVPGRGTREAWDPLGLLAGDRRHGREIVFGVDAEVVTAGTVAVGDPVSQV